MKRKLNSKGTQRKENRRNVAFRLEWPSDEELKENGEQQLWVDKFAPKYTQELSIPPKKVEEIRSWAEQAFQMDACSKFLVLTGSPGTGKSTCIHCLASEIGLNVLSWEESFHSYSITDSAIGHSSPIVSFELFLQQSRANYASVTQSTAKNLILLENPAFHDLDRLKSALDLHVQSSKVPTVLIHSEKERETNLISEELLYSQYVTTINVNKTTKPRMKKIIEQIAKAEGFRVKSDLIDELHELCEGDVRSAINTLQFQRGKAGAKGSRDHFFSTFHTLGKLLYAKRQTSESAVKVSSTNVYGTKWLDERNELDFDPEQVIENGDIESSQALSFVAYHAPDFYEDLFDIDRAMSSFSDAAFLASAKVEISTTEASVSIMGRTVAATNKKPAPHRFRKLGAPGIYEIYRRRSTVFLEQRASFRAYLIATSQLPSRSTAFDLLYAKALGLSLVSSELTAESKPDVLESASPDSDPIENFESDEEVETIVTKTENAIPNVVVTNPYKKAGGNVDGGNETAQTTAKISSSQAVTNPYKKAAGNGRIVVNPYRKSK